MKNLLKMVSLSIFTLLLAVGSSFAQKEVKPAKNEKSSGECCSTKEAGAKMKMENIDHKGMSDQMSIDKNKDEKIFECPMKCEAGKDVPEECAKCGMKLKEVSIKDSKHKHGNKDHKMMDHSKMDHSKMKHTKKDNKEMSKNHSIDKNKDGKIFECPMKCEAGKDAPGECSKCGMKLKEISIKQG